MRKIGPLSPDMPPATFEQRTIQDDVDALIKRLDSTSGAAVETVGPDAVAARLSQLSGALVELSRGVWPKEPQPPLDS